MADSNLRTLITRKIEQIPPQDWNNIFPKTLENYYFFKSIDESNFEQFSFFYIMVYDNNLPVAAAPCFLMRFPLDISVRGTLRRIFDCFKKISPNILSPTVLMCGLPMGRGRMGIAKENKRVFEEVRLSIERLAKEQKAAMIIFKDFTSADDDLLKPLIAKGYAKVESIPSTEMDINFDSFDEYLKTLSRSSRENLKRNFKKVDGRVNITVEVRDALEESVIPRVYELYLATYNKQDMGLEKLPVEFFKNISRNMPGEVKYFLWKIEEKIVAFAFCLIKEDYFIDYYLGFDYQVSYEYYLYFVRFRDLLNWCIAHKISKYEMGVTTYEPKRRLGFDFIRLYFYMKHCNKLLNPFVNIVSLFLGPRKFEPVFKEMGKEAG